MNLNRWISILVCLSLFLVTTPWSSTRGISSIVSHAKASELLPEGTRLDTLEWTKEYIQKIQALEIWENHDSRDAFQLVKRGDFARWLVKARHLPLKESKHTFSDLDPSDPNFPYIMTALEAGIIEKTPNFRPKDPLLRADAGIWLVNAHGDLAKKRAQEYSEPLIPAQDGYDGIPAHAVGALSVCYAPDYQMMEYRHLSLDEFRYVQAEAPLLTGEAAYSLYQLVYPPKRGGGLNVMVPITQTSLFPGTSIFMIMNQVVTTLYEGVSGGHYPYTASFPTLIKRIPTLENGSWVVHHDDKGEFSYMELTFELRKGLKWSDGSPLTADDFVFGYYLYLHPSFSGLENEIDFWIDKVEALDEHTLRSTWNTPYQNAKSIFPMPRYYFEEKFNYHLEPYSLIDPEYYIPPSDDNPEGYKSAKYLQDENFIKECIHDKQYNTQPLHAGPYRVKEWYKGDRKIILEPNEHYIFGKPMIEEVVFKCLETDYGIQLILQNDIHVSLASLTFDQIQHIESLNKNITSSIDPSSFWKHLSLNVDDEVFSDIRVRHALAHGINREKITQDLYLGKIDISNSWFPPMHPAYDDKEITKYDHNIEKAKSLLDEAGWKLNPDTGIREKEGQPLGITFITTQDNHQRKKVQASIASDWKDIGIKVTIRNMNSYNIFITNRERRFDGPTVILSSWIMSLHSNLYSKLHSSNIPTRENGFAGQNFTGFQHEEVDKILDKIVGELEFRTNYPKLKKIQSIVTQELPSIPLYFRPNITAVHRDLVMYQTTDTTMYSGFNSFLYSPQTWNIAYWYWKSEETKTLPPPKLQFSPKDIDFGALRKSDPPLQKLEITNDGGETLELNLSSPYPALQLSETQLSIPPRVSKSIMVKLDLSLIESYGVFKGTLNIESNDPKQAKVNIPFKGRYGVKIQLTIGNSKGIINDEEIFLDLEAPPFIHQGRSMMHIYFIGSAFGAKVEYIPVPREIQITLDRMRIHLWIDNPKALIEPIPPSKEAVKEVILDVPPITRSSRAYLPIRFISETFGAKVEWEASTQTITIYYKG